MTEPTADPPRPTHPGVRTTRHRGRMTDAKRALLVDLAPRWSIGAEGPWTADRLAAAFGRTAPLHVDIGVGDGVATRAWAAEHPDVDVLAIELHRPGVSTLFAELEAGGPPNIRVAMADACAVLAALDPGSVDHIRVLFPDPWPKRRHVERRLVDRTFAVDSAEAIRVGGTLHLATDWAEYAEHMRMVLAAEPRFAPLGAVDHDDGWRSLRPGRPITAYEQRGLTAGRTVTDLLWTRTAATT